MSAVTNQLPYTPLKPLPQPKEVCPCLTRALEKALLVITVIGFSFAAGAALSLAGTLLVPAEGAVLGGIVGTVVAIAVAFLMHVPSCTENYRIHTLSQIQEVMTSGAGLSGLNALHRFFYYPLTQFKQCFYHHELMKALSLVTSSIDPQRPDIVKVWEVFLKTLDGTKVLNPGGEEVKLDMQFELMRLQRKNVSIKTEWLGPSMSEEDLDQIIALSLESFGKIGAFSKEDMRQKLRQRKSGCVVARSQETNEILGFSWYFEENGKIEIAGIARKPKATYLKIGDKLMFEVVKAQWSGTPMQLIVRKSNPAVEFYENWKFVKDKEIPNYYAFGPKEDGILMHFDWEAYRNISSRS